MYNEEVDKIRICRVVNMRMWKKQGRKLPWRIDKDGWKECDQEDCIIHPSPSKAKLFTEPHSWQTHFFVMFCKATALNYRTNSKEVSLQNLTKENLSLFLNLTINTSKSVIFIATNEKSTMLYKKTTTCWHNLHYFQAKQNYESDS